MTVRRILIAGTLSLFAAVALAHPGIDEQIADLDARIAETPDDARLYLRRGELHRIHRDWKMAEDDLRHALKLDPELVVVQQSLGRLMLDSDRPEQALAPLRDYLTKRPEDTKTLALLSRTYMQLGRHLDAARSYSATLASVKDGKPRPEYYLERARALRAAGPEYVEETLRGLDEGLRVLDGPVTLQLYAIETEMLHGRYDQALKRVDRIAAASARKETWLLRKGEILEKAGRFDEARAAFRGTLDAIEALSADRRTNRAVMRLEEQASAGLERVESQLNASASP